MVKGLVGEADQVLGLIAPPVFSCAVLRLLFVG